MVLEKEKSIVNRSSVPEGFISSDVSDRKDVDPIARARDIHDSRNIYSLYRSPAGHVSEVKV